jgi:hypothetical protein
MSNLADRAAWRTDEKKRIASLSDEDLWQQIRSNGGTIRDPKTSRRFLEASLLHLLDRKRAKAPRTADPSDATPESAEVEIAACGSTGARNRADPPVESGSDAPTEEIERQNDVETAKSVEVPDGKGGTKTVEIPPDADPAQLREGWVPTVDENAESGEFDSDLEDADALAGEDDRTREMAESYRETGVTMREESFLEEPSAESVAIAEDASKAEAAKVDAEILAEDDAEPPPAPGEEEPFVEADGDEPLGPDGEEIRDQILEAYGPAALARKVFGTTNRMSDDDLSEEIRLRGGVVKTGVVRTTLVRDLRDLRIRDVERGLEEAVRAGAIDPTTSVEDALGSIGAFANREKNRRSLFGSVDLSDEQILDEVGSDLICDPAPDPDDTEIADRQPEDAPSFAGEEHQGSRAVWAGSDEFELAGRGSAALANLIQAFETLAVAAQKLAGALSAFEREP